MGKLGAILIFAAVVGAALVNLPWWVVVLAVLMGVIMILLSTSNKGSKRIKNDTMDNGRE